MNVDESAALDELATEFANKLTALTRGVLGQESPQFHAVNVGTRVRVAPIRESETTQHIPLTIDGKLRLRLWACYYCCWDGSSTFLATDKAVVHLFYATGSEPLLRFEYERGWTDPPGAHIQVHAHRDEVAYLLRLAEGGRPQRGFERDRMPRLAEMHLPVGGHRMRPSLEDVLLFLRREFNIDVQEGWRSVVEERLREWRETQLKSAVRDAPQAAVEVLRSMGYRVERPVGLPAQRVSHEARLYLP